MTPIAFLRQMLAAGVDMETAMKAAETFEQSAQAEHDKLVASLLDRLAVDAKAEKRRAKDRERKRVAKGTGDGIPRNSADSAESAETKEAPPAPPKKITPIPPLKGGTFPEIPASPEKPKLKPISAWVAEIWEATPRPGRERSGRRDLENALKAAERRGADLAAIKAGVGGYYASADATKDHGQFAKGVHVVVSSGRWEAFAETDPEPQPPGDGDPWPSRLKRWEMAGYWNSEWGPKPGKPGYRGPDPPHAQAA